MPERSHRFQGAARVALAGVRLVNGSLGLFAPQVLIRRLGDDPEASPTARYAFRLFGVRTIVLAAELLLRDGPVRDHVRRTAVVIHASDTAAAAFGGLRREVPPRVAAMTVLISGLNTVLALLARPRNG